MSVVAVVLFPCSCCGSVTCGVFGMESCKQAQVEQLEREQQLERDQLARRQKGE